MKQPVERRLAAILAADVAGYSRLMGADEEGTLDHLKAHLRELIDPKIREHRGHCQNHRRRDAGRISERRRYCALRRRDSARNDRRQCRPTPTLGASLFGLGSISATLSPMGATSTAT